MKGDEGWIHSSLLDSTPTVIVKVARANIRTGPGTTYSLSFDANKGTPFKVLQKKERWLEVQHARWGRRLDFRCAGMVIDDTLHGN